MKVICIRPFGRKRRMSTESRRSSLDAASGNAVGKEDEDFDDDDDCEGQSEGEDDDEEISVT
jgi:hypothetical protein